MTREELNNCCNLSDDFRDSLNEIINENLKNEEASGLFQNFTSFTPRAQLSRFLVRNELFKLTSNIQGAIVECGVHTGFGMLSWFHLKSIYTPLDSQKTIIGFDTFEGFPDLSEKDINPILERKKGDISYDSFKMLEKVLALHSSNHYLSAFAKNYKLVKGDACITIPEFLNKYKHTLCSLLYLDFDLYEPTLVAIKNLLPRMSKGSIIAFDEVNCPAWPGETLALLDTLNLNQYSLKKFSFDTKISYIVI